MFYGKGKNREGTIGDKMNKIYSRLEKKEQSSLTLRYLILITALFFNFFNTGNLISSSLIGLTSYFITLVIMILILIKRAKKTRYTTLFVSWAIMLIFLYLIFNTHNNFIRLPVTIIQLCAIIMVVNVASIFTVDKQFLRMYKKSHLIMLMVLYISLFIRFQNITLMFNNWNSLSEMAALFMLLNIGLWYISNREIKLYNALVYIPALVASNGRNMILSVLVFIFVFLLWKMIVKNIFTRIISFGMTVSIIYYVTIKIPQWMYDPSMVWVNRYIRQLTGKNFFSGRGVIWNNIFNAIKGNEWVGYGTTTIYSQIMNSNLSAHNQYLQLYMQNGLVGIIMLFCVLFSIWIKLTKRCEESVFEYKNKRISGSMLLSFMIANIFTVSMLQNTFYSSLTAWFIIGIGLQRMHIIKIKF